MKRKSRRDLLKITGSSFAMSSIAGCVNSTEVDSSTQSVYTSFFTLYDFTRNVANKDIAVENPVPAEQHGHGWEPPTNLLPNIVESDAFVYLDAEGFQPWAEQVASEIEENYSDDVLLIDALEGIDLLEYESDHHEEQNHDTSDYEYGSVRELELIDRRTSQLVAHFHFDHWHGTIPGTSPQEAILLDARFIDSNGELFPLSDDEPYELGARVEENGSVDTISINFKGDHIGLEGQAKGDVPVIIELRQSGEIVWESKPLTVTVSEMNADSRNRDHGMYDVKFFSDPVLAQDGVRNIRDGLIDLDPSNETTYEENAEQYIGRLDDLHQRFRTELSDRDHDLAVLAGHDSFNYLGTRYGFEIHTPVGLSPDDEPSSTEIAAAVHLVEEQDIKYILWDYFDGDQVADAILSEADSANDMAMVSAAESYLGEWKDDGHGDYIGQMEKINLPAFKNALGATEQ